MQLYAANGTPIKVFGQTTIRLNLGLRRDFTWPFIIAAVTQPIIGADFLAHYDLMVDLKRNRLIDNVTRLQQICTIYDIDIASTGVRTFSVHSTYADVLAEFPSITRLTPTGTTEEAAVIHHIETTGPPVTARPRRLPTEKLSETY